MFVGSHLQSFSCILGLLNNHKYAGAAFVILREGMQDKSPIRREACHYFVLVSLSIVGATSLINGKIPDQHAATDCPLIF